MKSLSQLSVRSGLSFDYLFHGASAEVSALCFSPDGRWLCGVSSNLLRIWEMPGGELVRELDGFGAGFTPEGELAYIVTEEGNDQIEVLRLPAGETVWKSREQKESLYMLAVSPDGNTFVGGGYQEASVWDRRSRAKLWSFPTHPRVTTDIAFSPDGKRIITRSYGDVAVWSLVGDRLATIGDVTIGDDNDGAGGLAVSCRGLVAVTKKRAVELWNLEGERLARWETEEYMSSVAFNAEGDVLAVGSHQGEVQLVDVESREVIRTLKEPRGRVQKLAWSRDGVLAAAAQGDVDLWSDHTIGNPAPKAIARADEGDTTKRLERIREKSAKRGLRLNPPASLGEVERFEAQHGVALPLGFRRFITEVGDGGAGPPAYGLVPLTETAQPYSEPINLNEPFPFTTSCIWEEEEETRRRELLHAARDNGHLYLGTDGCGMDWALIVSGAERGHIWWFADVGAQPVEPRRDFLSWYEYWIDGGDDYWDTQDGENT